MTIPTAITDLSATPAANPPAGSDPISTIDDQQRAAYAFIRQLYDVVCAGGGGALTLSLGNVTYSGTLSGGVGAIAIGTNQLVKTASGNVGIGTATPAAPLVINRPSLPYTRWDVSGALKMAVGVGDGVSLCPTAAAGDGIIRAEQKLIMCAGGGAAVCTVDTAGNVGLGTTAPTARLEVSGDVLMGGRGTGYAVKFPDFRLYNDATNGLTLDNYSTTFWRLDASGNLVHYLTGSPPALAANNTVVWNLTSNTNLRVSVRGSDGVTRTANITLA